MQAITTTTWSEFGGSFFGHFIGGYGSLGQMLGSCSCVGGLWKSSTNLPKQHSIQLAKQINCVFKDLSHFGSFGLERGEFT